MIIFQDYTFFRRPPPPVCCHLFVVGDCVPRWPG